MKLRDHPMMNHRGARNWPPVWTKARGDDLKTVRGEVGVLIFVHSSPDVSTRIFLVIEHGGENFVGTLICDDKAFCRQIADLLRSQLNKPIKEIGDMDVSSTL